jgi:hypothetical protein
MESFFATLKTERLSKRLYRTRDELRADVFDYIERFYNPRRRHSTLGCVARYNLKIYNAPKRECPLKWGKATIAPSKLGRSRPAAKV